MTDESKAQALGRLAAYIHAWSRLRNALAHRVAQRFVTFRDDLEGTDVASLSENLEELQRDGRRYASATTRLGIAHDRYDAVVRTATLREQMDADLQVNHPRDVARARTAARNLH